MKSTVFFIVFLSAALAFPKGSEEPQFKRLYVDPIEPVPENILPRIINGQEVAPNSIPYQAYIILSGTTTLLCSGSLISPRYVLTVAHCLIGASSATVYLGAHDISEDDEPNRLVITTSHLIAHEEYEGSSITNDIGLIEFIEPVELGEHINVVSLPSRNGEVDYYVGLLGRVSGWGVFVEEGDTSPVLLAVNSTVISNRVCNNYFGIVQDHQVCISGAQGGATCNGDSGGPLVVGNEQIGLISYGVRGCLRGYPSVSTRTDSFLDWIELHTDLIF
ncbi:hypothetical protein NQ314_020882 [Rhamnusium bicolor]|uniref:Peptidase S1 domain-containing protein n=1 Tax=Rhamnusium bicolor TaxID=1586634 RepID=A0AAV8WJY0_9CUCU|nr:hypothetical protein NQ314_020882 [Rhamnusium bicolor]